MRIHMAQAGPMQEGFHISTGLVNDLDHTSGSQLPAMSHTVLLPDGNYVQVRQTHTVLPPPAGFVEFPTSVTLPYFWDQRDAAKWGQALQENADSGLTPSNWIPHVHPQYNLPHVPVVPPYQVPGPISQHGSYPLAPNIHAFSDPVRQQVRPTKKQWRTSQSGRKPKNADLKPQTNLEDARHHSQEDLKGKGVSSEINLDETSRPMGFEQKSTAGQADQSKKMMRPNLSQLEAWPFNRGINHPSRKPPHALDADSASFQPSTAPSQMRGTVDAIPSSSLDQVLVHNSASVSQVEEAGPKKNLELAFGNRGESVKVQGTKESQELPSTSMPTAKQDTLVPSGSQVSDKKNLPNQEVSKSSSSESSNPLHEQSREQEWEVYHKKNKKPGKYPPLKGTSKLDGIGHQPLSYRPEHIQLDKGKETKDANLEHPQEGEHKVEEENPEAKMVSGSQSNLDNETPAAGMSGEQKKNNRKNRKNRKKGLKQSEAEPLDGEDLLSAAAYLDPKTKSMIEKSIWYMVKGDNPKPLLDVGLDLPIYNKIFTLDAKQNDERLNLVDQIVDQQLDQLSAKVSLQEASRRFFAIQMQFFEENRLRNWQTQKERVGEAVKEIMEMLKGDEMWPAFYDATLDEWRLVERKISELNDDSQRQLESVMPHVLRARRLATIYASGQAKKNGHQMMYSEKELEAWMRQGVSAPLLIRVGDLLELTSPKANWRDIPDEEMGSKASDFFNCLNGEIALGHRLIYKEPIHWYLSGARMLILQDPKFAGTFNSRLEKLIKFGENRVTLYDKPLETQGKKSGTSVDLKKNAGISQREDQSFTFSEHMISTHFGIPSNKLLEFTTIVRFKNAVSKVSGNRSGDITSQFKAGITWPKGKLVTRDIQALKPQFHAFFHFLGIPFNDN
ncbi:uncharacterized protein MELLADRAFT_94227 [Melampsora larici-populina 98AG31]|uniref:Uncharacterized protein n=1 Tax=Melampsora larici-populina (strain 98AG31 / pathotype 3-4-7) TaxID=747676 RepID=F4S6Y2_MELLP|nr:uncharacterized protein MELLADRAFT_94227 [Melampsora larici-populina 98AG31]EGF99536.1 hypothetical protein MELLADRAFT_94227 [Melampsora larici-populina 98AG31]